MSGPQFIHVDSYARKATNTKTTTAKGVIGEAIRQEGFTSHLSAPQPPRFTHGSTEGLQDLDREIHEAAEAAKDGLGRKMRSDQSILLAGVASFPKPCKALNEDDKAEIEAWIEKTQGFLYKEFGGAFRAALLHTDEEYPHLHFYIADRKDPMKTTSLHPAASGGKERKNRSASLRGFQDRYNAEVGVLFGMTRFGPKRARLSRPDWLENKRLATELAKKLKALEAAEARTIVKESELDAEKIVVVIERAALREEKAELKRQMGVLVNAAERYNATEDRLRADGVKIPRKSIKHQADDNLVAAAKTHLMGKTNGKEKQPQPQLRPKI